MASENNGKREIKAGLGYTAGNILIKGIAFITLPVFSRLLTTEQYGVFTTYIAYEGLLAIILGLGMYSSIKNAKYDYPDRIDRYVATLQWLTVVPFAICLIVSFIFPTAISAALSLPKPLLILLVLQSYGAAMLSISNARLSIDYNYKLYMAFASFNTIVNVGLSVLLILTVFDGQREYGRVIGSAVPLILIGGFVFLQYEIKGKFAFDKRMAKYALAVGLPLIWHYLSQQVQSQFDRIAITNLVGSTYTGIYSFSYSIASILQVVFYSIENVWSVWMFGQMEEANYTTIRATSKKYMVLIATVAMLMLFFSREVIMLMGPRAYWDGATIFIPILIGIFLLYLYTVPAGIEYYYKKTKYIAVMTGIAATINISLNYLLIPIYGYIAAAYTTLISYAVQFIAHWFISKKILSQNGIKSVFEFADLLKAFCLVAGSGVVVAVTNPYPIVKYTIAAVLFGGMYMKYKTDIRAMITMLVHR